MSDDERWFDLPDSECPSCGAVLGGAARPLEPASGPPAAGDHSVCLECAALLVFDADLRPRGLSAAEAFAALMGPESEAIHRMVDAVKVSLATRPGGRGPRRTLPAARGEGGAR